MNTKTFTNNLDNGIKFGNSPTDYLILMKPRVMSLVVFTAFVGYFVGLSDNIDPLNPILASIGIFAIAIGAGASGALNQWYERDIDSIMERTKNRPIPSKKIEPSEALTFGIILSFISVIILGLAVNWFSALLLAFTIIFYAFIYTVLLKRSTIQNIVIGGASGAFPPVIGYSLIDGNISVEALILFGIIFLWTPPHFWALALLRQNEYKLANIPMLPVVYGEKITRKYILYYVLLLIPFSLLPFALGYSSLVYFSASILLGFEFLRRTHALMKVKTNSENKLFLFSITYLFLLFLSICLDKFYQNF